MGKLKVIWDKVRISKLNTKNIFSVFSVRDYISTHDTCTKLKELEKKILFKSNLFLNWKLAFLHEVFPSYLLYSEVTSYCSVFC